MASAALRPPVRPVRVGAAPGRPIRLRANHFVMQSLPSHDIQHYDVSFVPEKLPKSFRWELVRTLLQSGDPRLGGQNPAYDGGASIYTARPFPFDKGQETFELPNGNKTIKIKLKWAATVNMEILKQFVSSATGRQEQRQKAMLGMDDVQRAVQVLDIVIGYALSCRFVAVGRSFFSPPSGRDIIDLGGGKAIWRGFYASGRPSMWGVTLNVDVATKAFYKGLPIVEFLKEIVVEQGMRNCNVQEGRWNDRDREVLKRELRGLKVEVSHSGQRRTHRVIDLSRQPATAIKFDAELDGTKQQISVVDYMLRQYKVQLRFPHLPCLQVGAKEKKTYIPLELCTIASNQRVPKKLSDRATAEMIKKASLPAPQRRDTVMEKLHDAKLNDLEVTKEFGIRVSSDMCQLEGRVLDAPKMKHDREQVAPRQGAWQGRRIHKPPSEALDSWVLFNLDRRTTPDTLKQFFSTLAEVAGKSGMRIKAEPAQFKAGQMRAREMADTLRQWCEQAVKEKKRVQMVFVILPGKTNIYGEFKHFADCDLGVPSQCIQSKNVQRPNPMLCGNLLWKISGKLGGINFVIDPGMMHPIFKEPVIVIGADVTHPGIGNITSPSIAAVVGSLDSYPMKYSSRVRVQTHRQEIIADLKEMVVELLKEFRKATGQIPRRIFFYRDGVSESQFQFCLNEELRAIRAACTSLDAAYKPGITFITVQKRHHTRFFAERREDEQGKARNVPAGTVVDTGVVHPTDHDFFLLSHFGIQGTSRPAHYYVLWDDNKLTQDALQRLSFHLCHTYARCTRSVSIPAPAYYAHLAAFRARSHIEHIEFDDSESRSSGPQQAKPQEEFARAVAVQAAFKNSMYFL